MSLADLIRGKASALFATVTLATPATVERETRRSVATVATVTVTSPRKTESVQWSGWLLHFPDRDPLPVYFCPAVSHADALASYADAVAAEPIPGRTRRTATEAEAHELRGLIETVYCGETGDDRADALAEALSDPSGALRCYRSITKGEAMRRGSHELE